MGIYDRDYYRNEGPSYLGSLMKVGQVCTWLIVVNVVCFVVQIVTQSTPRHVWIDGELVFQPGHVSEFTDALILDVDAVLQGQVWRLLTYAFLHDPTSAFLLHLVINMVLLWWFGTEVETLYGSREFLAIYLIAAVFGGVLYTLGSAAGVQPGKFCLGASGAVTAVLVLFALHFPSRLVYFMGLVPMPIWLLVLINVGLDLVGFLNVARGHAVGFASRTAYTVHLGGALFAFAYYKLQLRVLNFLPDFRSWRRQRSRPKLRVYREEEPVTAPAPRGAATADLDEHLEAKVDAVLAKVAKHGQNSLTDNERQILLRASEVYKKKRT